MALPAIAALIARMVAGRAGMAALGEAIGTRGGLAAALRGASSAGAAEGEGIAAAASAARGQGGAAAASAARKFKYPEVELPPEAKKLRQELAEWAARIRARNNGEDGGGGGGLGRGLAQALGNAIHTKDGNIRTPVVRHVFDGAMIASMLRASSGGGHGGGGIRGGLNPSSAGGGGPEDQGVALAAKSAKLTLVFGTVASSGALVAGAFANVPRRIEHWGRGLLESQESLRRFNGTINAAFAELEHNDMVRAKERADATSGSTSALASTLNDLSESTKEFREAGTTIMNLFGIFLAKIGIVAAEAIKMQPQVQLLLAALEKIEMELKKNSPEQKAMRQFMGDLAAGKYTGKHKAKP